MKIFQYIPSASYFVGGGEIVPLNQAIFLAKAGHEVTLGIAKSSLRNQNLSAYDLENIEVVEFDIISDSKKYLEETHNVHREAHIIYFELSRKVNSYLTNSSHEFVFTHYPVANFCIPQSKKLVHFLHGVPPNWDTIGHSAIRLANKNIAVSKSVRQGWKEKFEFDKDVFVLNNGIDTEDYNYFEGTRVNLLFVGRLIEIKGVQFLIDAIKILKEKGIIFGKLTIIGDGEYRKELEDRVLKHNLNAYVEFLGRVDKNLLSSYYKSSLISIFPSYEREGVLTTMLESASSGCPIITSNCCGMVDFAIDNHNSILAEPKSAESIAEKLELLLKNDDLRNRITVQARLDVENNWSWEKYVVNLEKILEE